EYDVKSTDGSQSLLRPIPITGAAVSQARQKSSEVILPGKNVAAEPYDLETRGAKARGHLIRAVAIAAFRMTALKQSPKIIFPKQQVLQWLLEIAMVAEIDLVQTVSTWSGHSIELGEGFV